MPGPGCVGDSTRARLRLRVLGSGPLDAPGLPSRTGHPTREALCSLYTRGLAGGGVLVPGSALSRCSARQLFLTCPRCTLYVGFLRQKPLKCPGIQFRGISPFTGCRIRAAVGPSGATAGLPVGARTGRRAEVVGGRRWQAAGRTFDQRLPARRTADADGAQTGPLWAPLVYLRIVTQKQALERQHVLSVLQHVL